jgi:calcineurin-like phosphoesterase family protein
MKKFTTSDIHLFHKNILKFEPESRPFSSLDEMHMVIVNNWNNVVNVYDVVYIIGDVSFGKLTDTIDILTKLNGNLILIKGNHDHVLSRNPSFRNCFVRIEDLLEIKVNGQNYTLCHYPMLSWNKSHINSYQLFGHLHSRWKGNNKQLNVGMDCHNLTPIDFNDIPSLLSKLPDREDFFNK